MRVSVAWESETRFQLRVTRNLACSDKLPLVARKAGVQKKMAACRGLPPASQKLGPTLRVGLALLVLEWEWIQAMATIEPPMVLPLFLAPLFLKHQEVEKRLQPCPHCTVVEVSPCLCLGVSENQGPDIEA